jgi:hypothetical protein
MALEHVDTPEKLRDAILVLDCAQRAEAVTADRGSTTSKADCYQARIGEKSQRSQGLQKARRCFICNEAGHLRRHCPQKK